LRGGVADAEVGGDTHIFGEEIATVFDFVADGRTPPVLEGRE
jgi:hypothetical protein